MKKTFLIWGVVGLACLAIFIGFYDQVFPQSSLEVDISFRDAERIAQEYVVSQGYDVADYKTATTFWFGTIEQTFLQRTWGIEKYNNEIKRDGHWAPWGFLTRFFRPLEKEEFLVRVDSATGRVDSFRHLVEDIAPGAQLAKD